MIRFDREAPGGGLDAYVQIKNGKAEIVFVIYLALQQPGLNRLPDQPIRDKLAVIDIRMYDEKGAEAARMRCKVGRPAEGDGGEPDLDGKPGFMAAADKKWNLTTHTLLIYPHLWNAADAPYLYEVRASVTEDHQITDTLEILCPIFSMSNIPQKGFFLNEKPFSLHAVRYHVDENWFQNLEGDLKILKDLGANCICPDRLPTERSFYAECLKKGMIVWQLTGDNEHLPVFCGDEKALLNPDRGKQESFYLYQSRFSRQNVLYICNPEKKPVPGGSTCVTVYSNQKRVALYLDGILHEFKESAPVFRFEDVPVKREQTVISAQAGEQYISVTL